MGATTFWCESKGKTAEAAFAAAQSQARHEHGHCGYTGTIAEKDDFVVVTRPRGARMSKFVRDLIDGATQAYQFGGRYSRTNGYGYASEGIDSKYGPAGCVQLSKTRWAFFGWASE